MMPHITDFDAFFRSKKNANCILELEKSLLSDDDDCVLSSIDVFKDVFTRIFEKGMLHAASSIDAAEEKFRFWLTNRYNDFVAHLIGYLIHKNDTVQETSLAALMALVVLEGGDSCNEYWRFPRDLFQKIVEGLVSQNVNQHSLIMTFQQYTSYDDIKMYLLKAVLQLFQDTEQVTDIFLANCFSLLSTLRYPKEFSPTAVSLESNTLVSPKGVKCRFHLKQKVFSKLFSSAWGQFLKFSLPPSLLRRVLLILHKRVLPHMHNPCVMTDFLTDTYQQGGLLSLLSLHGLFYLMDKHNVEYPDFFVKLYSLFDEDIVNGKFSARFFYLSDLFLSSTHLPIYLVAAFAKRIARIALSSEADSLLRIVPFVCNLLIRHPSLSALLHRTQPTEPSGDPYNFEASDPAESRALESSLWEIKTLQNHIHPEVSRQAKVINHELPIVEYNLSKLLNTSLEQLYEKERKRKFVSAPTAVHRPPRLQDWWILSNKCFS